jgi:GntR family transcriptional regulator/MocR family aminotransferase
MSPSLPIDLDRSSGQPLYRQIERWIRHAIDGGRLPPGTRLPGVRTLARDLGVSVVPVITAYEQLGADGYLVTRVGLGTMVAPDPPKPIQRTTVTVAPPPSGGRSRPGSATSSLPVANSWVPPRPPRPTPAPTPSADADLTRRLARSWSRHLHRARLLTDAAPAAGPASRDDDLGLVWLRSMLAIRAGLSRADSPGPDQLIVTAGIQAAIAAVARTWLRPDRTVAVAGHYPSIARGALAATGARVIELDVDDDGRRLGPPRDGVDLIVVAPAIAADGQPLGLPGRRRLLEWAGRVGAVVLEDDRERELRAHRLPTIASLDTDGRVIGVGGIPAEIAPGAALGYLVVPAALHGPVAAMVLAGGQAPGRVEQEALALMLESGDFDRDVRRLRDALATTPAAPDGARARSTSMSGWAGPGSSIRLRNRP